MARTAPSAWGATFVAGLVAGVVTSFFGTSAGAAVGAVVVWAAVTFAATRWALGRPGLWTGGPPGQLTAAAAGAGFFGFVGGVAGDVAIGARFATHQPGNGIVVALVVVAIVLGPLTGLAARMTARG